MFVEDVVLCHNNNYRASSLGTSFACIEKHDDDRFCCAYTLYSIIINVPIISNELSSVEHVHRTPCYTTVLYYIYG